MFSKLNDREVLIPEMEHDRYRKLTSYDATFLPGMRARVIFSGVRLAPSIKGIACRLRLLDSITPRQLFWEL